MSERAAAYRSFKLAFILVGGLISVPVLTSSVFTFFSTLTDSTIEDLWAPLQPVLSVSWLLGILVWVLSPFAAMIAFYAVGTRAAGGILAGFGVGTLAAVLAFLLMAGAAEVVKRL